MPVYTVHAPPADDDGVSAPEDYAFVRDGFYVWAMIFGPLWLLVRRLWLVLLLYIVVMAALGTAIWAAGVREAVGMWPTLLIAILLGLEAGTLWRWTLSRRRWRQVGLVVADNLEEAERRFFDRFADTKSGPARRDTPPSPSNASPKGPPPLPLRPATPPPVIGLFPEPGASR